MATTSDNATVLANPASTGKGTNLSAAPTRRRANTSCSAPQIATTTATANSTGSICPRAPATVCSSRTMPATTSVPEAVAPETSSRPEPVSAATDPPTTKAVAAASSATGSAAGPSAA
jgi:hypothetical protein